MGRNKSKPRYIGPERPPPFQPRLKDIKNMKSQYTALRSRAVRRKALFTPGIKGLIAQYTGGNRHQRRQKDIARGLIGMGSLAKSGFRWTSHARRRYAAAHAADRTSFASLSGHNVQTNYDSDVPDAY